VEKLSLGAFSPACCFPWQLNALWPVPPEEWRDPVSLVLLGGVLAHSVTVTIGASLG
jgi:hypothetical protein